MARRLPNAFSSTRRRGQLLSTRNQTGGPNGVANPRPGNSPPIIPGGTTQGMPGPPAGMGTNAQGYDPIRYGQNNQKWGYAKVGQARNQPGGVPAPALSGLAAALADGLLPDRFAGGFKIGENTGKIIDTTVGMTSPQHAAQYQKLFNAAQAAGLNITGGRGQGGAYDPLSIYARGGNHNDYVDLTTGRINPPSTGGSGDDYAMVNQALLDRLRANSGWTAERQAGSANAGAMAGVPRQTPEQYTATTGQAPTVQGPATAAGPAGQDQGQVATPQSAFGNGRDPTKHAAYWAAQGWHQNPATGVWKGPNGQTWDQTPGDNAPTGNGGGGGGGGGTGGGGGGGGNGGGGAGGGQGGGGTGAPALSALPLDPQFESTRRMLDDQLSAQLAPLASAREGVQSYGNLANQRLQTNAGIDVQDLMDNLAARGVYQSGLYGQGRGDIATNYLRQGQDLAFNLEGQLSDIATQGSNAQLSYSQQLQEALIDLANRMTSDQNSPLPGASVGGGGGNWQPTWEPKWKPRNQRRRNR